MRKLNKLLAGVSVAVLAAFQAQATCVPADCNAMGYTKSASDCEGADMINPADCNAMGYTKSASDCEGADMIKCPFDTNQVWCAAAGDPAANATPGMILYSDGTVSNDVVSGKTAVGVVAYVDGSTRFAVALEESGSILRWSTPSYEDLSCLTNYSSTAAQTDFRGATNTSCIVNYSSNNSYPAAEYCNTYKPVSSGKGSSGWYLPAAGELYVMNFSYGAINLGLQKLSKTQLSNDYYWSSSEHYSSYAWNVSPSDGSVYTSGNKNGNSRVRCVLAF